MRLIYLLLIFTFSFVDISAEDPCLDQPEPFTLVIFGSTGDLSARKLFPAAFNLVTNGCISDKFALVGIGRKEEDNHLFREKIYKSLQDFSRNKPNSESWEKFKDKLFYHKADFTEDEGYQSLKEKLKQLDQKIGSNGKYLFYLATEPSYFPEIIEKLDEHGFLKSSSVIIEKPFGYDLDSAQQLQKKVLKHLKEDQIFLIDHYTGKEGVQNLSTLRFENPLFEALWDNNHIDHVQITLAESIGIGSRAAFWEKTGTLRDVVQNHVMQVLALLAMERPENTSAEALLKEKVKVLNAIRPYQENEIDRLIYRSQYTSGVINGESVKGYKEEMGVLKESASETFIATKLFIDNERWSGVPFYIRAGKRLEKQSTEIAVVFKNNPFNAEQENNVLHIKIQPNASVNLKILSKNNFINNNIVPVTFGFKLNSNYKGVPEAYEKLIYDAALGDHSLFAGIDEILAAWSLFTPILKHWENNQQGLSTYEAGSYGPAEADLLLEPGHRWLLLENSNS